METNKTDTGTATDTKAGEGRGAAIGGAIGRTVGAVVDVVIGAVSGGIDAGKKSNGQSAVGDVVKGALAGGLAAGKSPTGKSDERADPAAEHEFWRKEFGSRPYVTNGTSYEQYGPAFQFGWDSQAAHKGQAFSEVEPQLARDWESRRGTSRLSWTQAKSATHDAWQRVEKACGGDSCGA